MGAAVAEDKLSREENGCAFLHRAQALAVGFDPVRL